MTSTRNDPDRDLDWIPRQYPDGPEVIVPPRAEPARRTLTSQQKNFRARRIEEEHAHLKDRGTYPDSAALDAMTPDQRRDTLEQIERLRAEHSAAGGAGEVATTEQLSLEEVDPEELDPGRPF